METPAATETAATEPTTSELPTAPARSAARARVPLLAALPQSLECGCLVASPGTPDATSLAAEAPALR